MELTDVQLSVQPPFATITLNRPDARNAYSEAMVDGLLTALAAASADETVRVILLTGAGTAFSAGGDLKRMRDKAGMFAGGPAVLRSNYIAYIQRIPRAIRQVDKPMIAAVNGPAIGAGLDLACMCEFRIASKAAKFGSTFVKVGLIPGDGGAYYLARTIGLPNALEMILTGKVIGAEEALGLGLVHRVVEGDVVAAARSFGETVAANPPVAVQLAKRAVYRSFGMDEDLALELAATYQGIAQTTEDHEEAVRAMLDKRTPTFRGK